jgi:hypothetical protein
MEMKMVKFSGSDSFIGFLYLENVGVEPKIVSLSSSQAEISFFKVINSALHNSGVNFFLFHAKSSNLLSRDAQLYLIL